MVLVLVDPQKKQRLDVAAFFIARCIRLRDIQSFDRVYTEPVEVLRTSYPKLASLRATGAKRSSAKPILYVPPKADKARNLAGRQAGVAIAQFYCLELY